MYRAAESQYESYVTSFLQTRRGVGGTTIDRRGLKPRSNGLSNIWIKTYLPPSGNVRTWHTVSSDVMRVSAQCLIGYGVPLQRMIEFSNEQ
jgi:hypothetical protein